MTKFSHRERVLVSLNHNEPDRVPIDFGGGYSWGIADRPQYGYRSLCKYLGIKDYVIAYKNLRSFCPVVDERILKYFDVDIRHISMNEPLRKLPNGLVEDSWGTKWKAGGYNYMPVDSLAPLAKAKYPTDVEKVRLNPQPTDPIYIEGARKKAKMLREKSDFAIATTFGAAESIFQNYTWLRGYYNWFLDMKLNPDFYKALADRIYEISTDLITLFLNEIADYIDFVCIADDLGSQYGPLISLNQYKVYFEPWIRRRVMLLRKLLPKDIKILMHTCGSVFSLIPELIDAGINILNPIQTTSKDMDPKKLKKNFGRDLCFHGGIDVQRILPFGTEKDVQVYTENLLRALAPGGGFIAATTHVVQGDVPPQNLCMAFKIVKKWSYI